MTRSARARCADYRFPREINVIYVNAGATRPADIWLDRLKEGGRLILPLTADGFPNRDVRHGAVFRIERRGPEFQRTGARRGLRQGRRRARHQAVHGATICLKTNVGCARLAGVWLTADAPDILHQAPPGRGGGRRLSDLCFRSKAVWGYDP